MAKLTLVGMDPSLRHWGLSKGVYDTETNELEILDARVVVTEKVKDKRAQNIRDIADVETLLREVYPYTTGADAILIECPVGSQSADAMKSYAVCVTIIACLKCAGRKVIITTPMQGKAVVTGTNDPKANAALNITKKEVITWVVEKHPETPFPRYKRNGEMRITMDSSEHIADSIIAIHAGINHQAFKDIAHA